MSKKDEALKLALEALETVVVDVKTTPTAYEAQRQAITALREALANKALDKMAENARELGLDYEPAQYSDIVSDGGLDPRNKFDKPAQQEPVAWQVMVEDEAMKEFSTKDIAHDWCVQQKLSGSSYTYWIRPLYTRPLAREWVGLTDEEITELHHEIKVRLMGTYKTEDIYRAIEAKLKEKNT